MSFSGLSEPSYTYKQQLEIKALSSIWMYSDVLDVNNSKP